ncbi:hypothetical protein C8J55DRAFT_499421 [Lentinula edodes]|uniref:Uncharacterized protein n=1 Tax=Lentinula lateritia TaxID=40482 RepID=A0A9W9B0G2_9AGAR|nr:hypothetical protein C8J55DRAFT_499421 [Lentinula edodes]
MADTAPRHKAQGVAVMLLVDNSRFTEIAWSDLRDLYLPSLFDKLSSVHASASITTFVQECCSNGNMDEVSPLTPRKYHKFQDAIRDLRFNPVSTYRFTGQLILETIKFLSATAALARHIVILGSSPLQNKYSSIDWHRLAQSLATGSIYCHLMLHAHAAGPTDPLSLMFDETLRLQRSIEDNAWFTDHKSQIVLRLTSVHTQTPRLEVTPLKVISPLTPSRGLLPAPLAHPVPSASNQSMHVPTPPTSASDEELPSIVTQLQQMHGLTKKKVYGTKPKRLPFVSSEVYRESSRKAASLSPVSPSDTNHGGRVTSPSLIDRTTRVHQSGSVLPHPGFARSLADVGSSGPTSVFHPAPSYRQPTMTMSVPSSPVSNRPPFYLDSPEVSPRITYHQPQPSSITNATQPHAVHNSASYFTENKPVKAYSRGDGGASLSTQVDRLSQKNQNQDSSINATTSYSVPRSVYRDELLSHLGGPSVGSTSSDHLFTQDPSSESTPYVENAQKIESYPPLNQHTPWHAPYDSQYDLPSNQISTISQYGMTSGHSTASSYPSSPVSSQSNSLTGWAG